MTSSGFLWRYSAASVLALFLSVGAVRAQEVLYDNGVMLVGADAWAVTGPLSVSDSFTLSGPSTIQVINVGLTFQEGFTLGGVTWSLGSTEFGGDLRGPTVADPVAVLLDHQNGYDYYMCTITISNPVEVAAAGTYWLTLSDAYLTDQPGHEVYWTQSNGLSIAWQVNGTDEPQELPHSQSFAIVGVPEPSAAVLAVASFAGLALRRRSRS